MAETQSAPSLGLNRSIQDRLRAYADPAAEAMSDGTRLSIFVVLAHEAADALDRAGRLIDPITLTEAVAAARAEGVREGLERAEKQIRAAHEFVARHPALNEADQAELRAFMAIPAMFDALTPGGRTDG